MKNILVGIDFDKYTELLIGEAINWAEKFKSKLWLLHVANPSPKFGGYEGGFQFIRDIAAKELLQEEKQLLEFKKYVKGKGVDAECLLIQGATVETIFEESKLLNIDLIVSGHHDYGFFHQIFFGSTATELVKKSQIPVLVVPFG